MQKFVSFLAKCGGLHFCERIYCLVSRLRYEAYQGQDDDAVIGSEL